MLSALWVLLVLPSAQATWWDAYFDPLLTVNGTDVTVDRSATATGFEVHKGTLWIGKELTISPGESQPTLEVDLVNSSISLGDSVVASVPAAASPEVSFAWSKDGDAGAVLGSTRALAINGTTVENSGTYTCTVSHTDGSTWSDSATLTVEQAEDGQVCTIAADCVSGICEDSTCVSCEDGVHNQDETCIDAGGVCTATCLDGQGCSATSDCSSGVCEESTCVSCEDDIQNQDETCIDAGGTCTATCTDGQGCAIDSDCSSGVCEANVCVSCNDGIQNQDEDGVDCGGVCVVLCPGALCSVDGDCANDDCDPITDRCASCDDNRQNQDEEGTDCGGSCSLLCADAPCTADAQCISGDCESGTSACASCFDGYQNLDEEGVDCGPSCASDCPVASCKASECDSGVCWDNECVAESTLLFYLYGLCISVFVVISGLAIKFHHEHCDKSGHARMITFFSYGLGLFAFLDLVSDVGFATSTFTAHTAFGVVCVLLLMCSMGYNISIVTRAVKMNARDDTRDAFNAVLIVLACTNPELLALLPWKYKDPEFSRKAGGLPTVEAVTWTLRCMLLEDVPQLVLQLIFVVTDDATTLVGLSLLFTTLRIVYAGVLKLLNTCQSPDEGAGDASKGSGATGLGDVELAER